MNTDKFYREISIIDIMVAVKKKLAVLILVPVIAALVVFAYASFIATPVYTSTASLLITKGVESDSDITATWNNNVYSEVLAVQQLTDIYSLILTSESMMDKIKQDLKLDISVTQLISAVSISAIKDSGLKINVTMEDPVLAKKVADKIVENANSEVAVKIGIGAVVELSSPEIPTSPSAPRVKMMTFSAFVLAFMAMFILIVILFYFDDRIKDEEELVKMFNIPVLGMIPKYDFDK